MTLESKTVLVTGANRGFGRELAAGLLARGVAKLYATAREGASLGDLANDARVVPLTFDITNESQIAAAAASVSELDVLINNAGSLAQPDLFSGDLRLLERDVEVNVLGTLRVTRAFLPALERSKGTVVNILTVAALAGFPPMATYAASKAASHSLTQTLRAHLAHRGVTVVSVFPSTMDTDMIRHMPIPKAAPAEVAAATLDALDAGETDIFPDGQAQQLSGLWRSNPKALEQVFAGFAGAPAPAS
jgi:NAD(P)-dependent dehydrogenase (short-subunit alcohol dehydrogenase family)